MKEVARNCEGLPNLPDVVTRQMSFFGNVAHCGSILTNLLSVVSANPSFPSS